MQGSSGGLQFSSRRLQREVPVEGTPVEGSNARLQWNSSVENSSSPVEDSSGGLQWEVPLEFSSSTVEGYSGGFKPGELWCLCCTPALLTKHTGHNVKFTPSTISSHSAATSTFFLFKYSFSCWPVTNCWHSVNVCRNVALLQKALWSSVCEGSQSCR